MILYQTALSGYSAKVRLAAALKGAVLDLREPPGGSYRSDAYRALVPAATVPALASGDLVLTESDAIAEYLDETVAGPPLLPPTAAGRARARMLSRIVDLRLEASLRRLYPMVANGGPPPGELAGALAAWDLVFRLADEEGPFLAGTTPTLPDCGLAAAVVWLDLLADRAGVPVPPTPRTAAWRDAVAATPAMAGLLGPYRALAAGWLASR